MSSPLIDPPIEFIYSVLLDSLPLEFRRNISAFVLLLEQKSSTPNFNFKEYFVPVSSSYCTPNFDPNSYCVVFSHEQNCFSQSYFLQRSTSGYLNSCLQRTSIQTLCQNLLQRRKTSQLSPAINHLKLAILFIRSVSF